MTIGEKFVAAIEAYYGAFPRQAVKTEVLKYAACKSREYLQMIYKLTIENISCQYNYVPDLAALKGIEKLIPLPAPPALPEPEITPAERTENLRILAELKNKYSEAGQDGNGKILHDVFDGMEASRK